MKIKAVIANNRRKVFEVKTSAGTLPFPYAKAVPRPREHEAVRSAGPDKELGCEGFGYTLASGKTGTVHLEQVLEYNQDPGHLHDVLVYRLTIEAQKRMSKSHLSKRELVRRLATSASQLYRLLDQTNTRKSVDKMLELLGALDCDVELVVHAKPGSPRRAA